MKVIFFPKEYVRLDSIEGKELKNEFHNSYENIFGNHSGLVVLVPI